MNCADSNDGSNPPQAVGSRERGRRDGVIRPDVGQIVLVLQGGGALGAYQAGAYEALHASGLEPDWVIGTSIGAINAGLIVGNEPASRVERLREFWRRLMQDDSFEFGWERPWFGRTIPNWFTLANGVKGFFEPNLLASFGPHIRLAPETVGYYSTRPLERTLNELVDASLLSQGTPRLTVGAANLRSGNMHYFDSRDIALTARHLMASGALPPAFPPIRIDRDLYWDGGILSNTPIEAVFDDHPRRSSLIFAVQLWNPNESEPDSLWKAVGRQKELQYSSRATSHIVRQRQIHHLRHVITALVERLPPEARNDDVVRAYEAYGCVTQMHVVRLLAPRLDNEDHTKDIDFSKAGVTARWTAGFEDMRRAVIEAPWEKPVDPVEGFHLHEFGRSVP